MQQEAITSLSTLVPALWKELPALLDDVGRVLATIDQEYADYLTEERRTVTAAARVALQEMVEAAEQRLTEVAGRLEWEQTEHSEAPGAEPLGSLALLQAAGREHFPRVRPLNTLL